MKKCLSFYLIEINQIGKIYCRLIKIPGLHIYTKNKLGKSLIYHSFKKKENNVLIYMYFI